MHDARCDVPMLHPPPSCLARFFEREDGQTNARTFDSSLYRSSPPISPQRASFRFRLGRKFEIRITVADRLSQPRETGGLSSVSRARAGRPPTSEAGTERSVDRWCARSTPRVHARAFLFAARQATVTREGRRRFRIWKDAFVVRPRFFSADVMTSPVPGLRLLDESRTRDGQGEDLNEDDVWDVAGDGDEEDEDDVLPFPDRSERDSDVEPSDVDDELTAEDDDVSGRTDAVAASPAASSCPARSRTRRSRGTGRPRRATPRSANAFRFEPEKKPRVAASAPLSPTGGARARPGLAARCLAPPTELSPPRRRTTRRRTSTRAREVSGKGSCLLTCTPRRIPRTAPRPARGTWRRASTTGRACRRRLTERARMFSGRW